MSYLASWIIILASASHISAQGFYAGGGNGAGNGFGGGFGGGNSQTSGGFGGPGQQRQAVPQMQGRNMDAANPQQPNQPSGMSGLPVIFTNPAVDTAPAIQSSAAQMTDGTVQGQQPLVNSALLPQNTVPIGTSGVKPLPATGAILPVSSAASPLYAGVSATGLYGGRLVDAGLSRYRGNGLDDQWGTAGLGYGTDRYGGLYGSGYGDEFGGAGGYGRDGYGSGQFGRGGQGNSGFGGQGGAGMGGPGGSQGNSGFGGQGNSGMGGPGGGQGGNRGGWNM